MMISSPCPLMQMGEVGRPLKVWSERAHRDPADGARVRPGEAAASPGTVTRRSRARRGSAAGPARCDGASPPESAIAEQRLESRHKQTETDSGEWFGCSVVPHGPSGSGYYRAGGVPPFGGRRGPRAVIAAETTANDQHPSSGRAVHLCPESALDLHIEELWGTIMTSGMQNSTSARPFSATVVRFTVACPPLR